MRIVIHRHLPLLCLFAVVVLICFPSLGRTEWSADKVISKERVKTEVLWNPPADQYVSLFKDDTELRIPVKLLRHYYQGIVKLRDGRNAPLNPIQYELQSVGETRFSWSFWDLNEQRYHYFKLSALKPGKTILTFVKDPGLVIVLTITGPNDETSSLNVLLRNEISWEPKDVIWPDLNSPEMAYDVAAERPGVFVDDVTEKNGEPRVVVRGWDPNFKQTFAFRHTVDRPDGEWVLVKPGGKSRQPNAWTNALLVVVIGLLGTLLLLLRRRRVRPSS